jgi:hypothetical protein
METETLVEIRSRESAEKCENINAFHGGYL